MTEQCAIAEDLPDRDLPGLMIITVAAVVIVYAVLNSQTLQSANDRSRWCTVWSLVERGTYQIDEIDSVAQWSTIDKVRHRSADDQPYHFYSSKPPLFATMVAGLYWLEKVTLGYNLDTHTTIVTRLLLFLVNAIPMILALLSLRNSLRLMHVSRTTRWLILAAAGFTPMLLPFLTTLNNHTPGAVCLLFSMAAIVRMKYSPQPAARDFALLGFWAAMTVTFELPAALFGILSFLIAVTTDWKKTAQWYVPMALIPLAAFFITNWICTGGIKPFYAYYGTDKYVYVHEGIPSYWSEPQGIDANNESPAVYLFHCVIGHHGILSMTPIYLLTLLGWLFGLTEKTKSPQRLIMCLGAGLTAVVLGFYLTRTQNYNYGGNSSTLRWMLWLTPLWWFGMIPAIERMRRSGTGIVAMVLLLAVSAYSPSYSLTRPWKPSWIFTWMETQGWIDYRTKIPPFEPKRYAVLNALPSTAGASNSYFGTLDAVGESLSVQFMEDVVVDGQAALRYAVEFQSRDGNRLQADVVALPDVMAEGKDITWWLKEVAAADSHESGVTSVQVKYASPWVTERLRGLPAVRAYAAASPRYLKYTTASGEKTAVKCERGASRVKFEHPEYGPCWQRCDVYYSNELPFGVAQWRITVAQQSTNQLVHTELWTCRELP